MIDQIKPSSWFKKTPLKVTVWLVLCVFLFNTLAVDSCLAEIVSSRPHNLSIWSFTERDTFRDALVKTYIDNRLVWVARSELYKNLLRTYDARALLLPSGRYLIDDSIKKDPIKFLRAVSHEDFEILWQLEERDNPGRYTALRDEILSNENILALYSRLPEKSKSLGSPGETLLHTLLDCIIARHKLRNKRNGPARDKQAQNILFNDIMSSAFEIQFLLREKVMAKNELTPAEVEFLTNMDPILVTLEAKDASDRYVNLSHLFFDKTARIEFILKLQKKKGKAKDEKFIRVTKEQNDEREKLGSAKDGSSAEEITIIDTASSIKAPEDRKPQLPRLSRMRVLVAEDDGGFRSVLIESLMRCDPSLQITTAANGQEALDIFLSRPGEFDMVFTDFAMPEKDGLSFAKQVKEKNPNIYIVLISGIAPSEQQFQDALKEGTVNAVLQKGVDLRKALGEQLTAAGAAIDARKVPEHQNPGHEMTMTGQKLTPRQDAILKEALKSLFDEGLMQSYRIRPGHDTYSRLDPDGELAGLKIIERSPPGADIFIIPDGILLKRLKTAGPDEARNILKMLVSHAGTFGGTAQNVFMLKSRAKQLLSLKDPLRRMWAHHEAEHIRNIKMPEDEVRNRAPIDPVLTGMKKAYAYKWVHLAGVLLAITSLVIAATMPDYLVQHLTFPVYYATLALIGNYIASRFDRDSRWTRFMVAGSIAFIVSLWYIPWYIDVTKTYVPDLGLWSHSLRPFVDIFIFSQPMLLIAISIMGIREKIEDDASAGKILYAGWFGSTFKYLKEKFALFYGSQGLFKTLVLFWFPINHFLYYSLSQSEQIQVAALIMPIFAIASAVFYVQRPGRELTPNPVVNKILTKVYMAPLLIIIGLAIISAISGDTALAMNAVSGIASTVIGYIAYRILAVCILKNAPPKMRGGGSPRRLEPPAGNTGTTPPACLIGSKYPIMVGGIMPVVEELYRTSAYSYGGIASFGIFNIIFVAAHYIRYLIFNKKLTPAQYEVIYGRAPPKNAFDVIKVPLAVSILSFIPAAIAMIFGLDPELFFTINWVIHIVANVVAVQNGWVPANLSEGIGNTKRSTIPKEFLIKAGFARSVIEKLSDDQIAQILKIIQSTTSTNDKARGLSKLLSSGVMGFDKARQVIKESQKLLKDGGSLDWKPLLSDFEPGEFIGLVSKEEIDRALRVAQWEDFKPDRYDGGRSVILKLRNPIQYKGKTYDSIKVKGVVFEEVFQPRPAQFLVKKPGEKPHDIQISDVDQTGRVIFREQLNPEGGIIVETARNEVTMMKKAFERGITLDIPLGVGVYKELEMQGSKMAYVVSLVCDGDCSEIPTLIERQKSEAGTAINSKSRIITNHAELPPLREGIEEIFYRQGQKLREAHDKGIYFAFPHWANAYVYDVNGEYYWKDFSEAQDISQVNEREPSRALAFRAIDIAQALQHFEQLSFYENNKLSLLKNTRINLQTAFLTGYFHDRLYLFDKEFLMMREKDIVTTVFIDGVKVPVCEQDNRFVRAINGIVRNQNDQGRRNAPREMLIHPYVTENSAVAYAVWEIIQSDNLPRENELLERGIWQLNFIESLEPGIRHNLDRHSAYIEIPTNLSEAGTRSFISSSIDTLISTLFGSDDRRGPLKDEALSVLPELDQRRVDAAVRFVSHIIKLGSMSKEELRRKSEKEPGGIAFDNISAGLILKFVVRQRKRGADLTCYHESWLEDAFGFLTQTHEILSSLSFKMGPGFASRVFSEAYKRDIPFSERVRDNAETVGKLVDFLLHDDSVEVPKRIAGAALAIEEFGTNSLIGHAQGALDRIALYAERRDDPKEARIAHTFLSYFADNLFESAAMAHVFMFNRAIVEKFLEPQYASKNNVGVVYLLAGSAHIYNQAKQIAEAEGIDTSRMHAAYINRVIGSGDKAALFKYIEEQALTAYDELVIVDTGFHGNSACKLADALAAMPKAPKKIHGRLLCLNEKPYKETDSGIDVIGWNNLLAKLGQLPRQKDDDALFFLTHLLDNAFTSHYRSPTALQNNMYTQKTEPVLVPTELPALTAIVEDSMRKGTAALLSRHLEFPHPEHPAWDTWSARAGEPLSDGMAGGGGGRRSFERFNLDDPLGMRRKHGFRIGEAHNIPEEISNRLSGGSSSFADEGPTGSGGSVSDHAADDGAAEPVSVKFTPIDIRIASHKQIEDAFRNIGLPPKATKRIPQLAHIIYMQVRRGTDMSPTFKNEDDFINFAKRHVTGGDESKALALTAHFIFPITYAGKVLSVSTGDPAQQAPTPVTTEYRHKISQLIEALPQTAASDDKWFGLTVKLSRLILRDDSVRRTGESERHACQTQSGTLNFILNRMGVISKVVGLDFKDLPVGVYNGAHFCIKTADGVYIDPYPEGMSVPGNAARSEEGVIILPGDKAYSRYSEAEQRAKASGLYGGVAFEKLLDNDCYKNILAEIVAPHENAIKAIADRYAATAARPQPEAALLKEESYQEPALSDHDIEAVHDISYAMREIENRNYADKAAIERIVSDRNISQVCLGLSSAEVASGINSEEFERLKNALFVLNAMAGRSLDILLVKDGQAVVFERERLRLAALRAGILAYPFHYGKHGAGIAELDSGLTYFIISDFAKRKGFFYDFANLQKNIAARYEEAQGISSKILKGEDEVKRPLANPITDLAFPSVRDAVTLEKCVRSHLAAMKAFGHKYPTIWVMDDATGEIAAEKQVMLGRLVAEFGVTVNYVGEKEKSEFLDALSQDPMIRERGLSRGDLIRIYFQPGKFGSNRNFVQCYLSGRIYATVDDDSESNATIERNFAGSRASFATQRTVISIFIFFAQILNKNKLDEGSRKELASIAKETTQDLKDKNRFGLAAHHLYRALELAYRQDKETVAAVDALLSKCLEELPQESGEFQKGAALTIGIKDILNGVRLLDMDEDVPYITVPVNAYGLHGKYITRDADDLEAMRLRKTEGSRLYVGEGVPTPGKISFVASHTNLFGAGSSGNYIDIFSETGNVEALEGLREKRSRILPLKNYVADSYKVSTATMITIDNRLSRGLIVPGMIDSHPLGMAIQQGDGSLKLFETITVLDHNRIQSGIRNPENVEKKDIPKCAAKNEIDEAGLMTALRICFGDMNREEALVYFLTEELAIVENMRQLIHEKREGLAKSKQREEDKRAIDAAKTVIETIRSALGGIEMPTVDEVMGRKKKELRKRKTVVPVKIIVTSFTIAQEMFADRPVRDAVSGLIKKYEEKVEEVERYSGAVHSVTKDIHKRGDLPFTVLTPFYEPGLEKVAPAGPAPLGSLARAIITINRRWGGKDLTKIKAFTKEEFQKARSKMSDPHSNTTVYSELNGLIALGILEVVNRSDKLYSYRRTSKYARAPPKIKREITYYLKTLPARPTEDKLTKARQRIKIIMSANAAVATEKSSAPTPAPASKVVKRVWATTGITHHAPERFTYTVKIGGLGRLLRPEMHGSLPEFYSASLISNDNLSTYCDSNVGLILEFSDDDLVTVLKRMDQDIVDPHKTSGSLESFMRQHLQAESDRQFKNIMHDSVLGQTKLNITPEELIAESKKEAPSGYDKNNELIIKNSPSLVVQGAILIAREHMKFETMLNVLEQDGEKKEVLSAIKRGLPVVIVGEPGADLEAAKMALMKRFSWLVEISPYRFMHAEYTKAKGAAPATPAVDAAKPTDKDARKRFEELDAMVNGQKVYNRSVSACGGNMDDVQKIMKPSRLRSVIPIEVLKNSVDITLLLKKRFEGRLNIPFRLEISGVKPEDEVVVRNLKEKLQLNENIEVVPISEEAIQEKIRENPTRIRMSQQQLRVSAIKKLSLSAAELGKKEYMMVVTDPVIPEEAAELSQRLKADLDQNVSIRIMASTDPKNSLFMLSRIINSWLRAIEKGHGSTIIRLPTLVRPEEMMRELGEAVRLAWSTLIAA